MNQKRFTILHSNDMHGDFLAEARGAEGKLIGGLSLLSGYINQVRSHEQNIIYTIAGDMVQGSVIDSEFKGVSTIEIMNYLSPDVVTLGNHELDYGLPHLLFLEKMANFPIVNANLYIKKYHKRLMKSHLILEKDGFSILFIGIITDSVMNKLKSDNEIGTFISLEDASVEVGKICDAYKNDDIDLTILLTHIGFDSDRELAAMLKPEWGVDIIIGGHSHTLLDQPAQVNGILITQAGVGTDQIGRFDILVDDDTNKIVEWQWQLIPINSELTPPDSDLQKFIDSFSQVVDQKYSTLITRMAQKLTHPARGQETALGNLFADILAEGAHLDIVLLGSGSLRGTEMGPVVILRDLTQVFPYDDVLKRFTVTGEQLKRIFAHFMRLAPRRGEGEFFQVSSGVHAIYSDAARDLVLLELHGKPIEDTAHYTIATQDYHFKNSMRNLNLSAEELTTLNGSKVVATSIFAVVDEYLRTHQNLNSAVEGRLVLI